MIAAYLEACTCPSSSSPQDSRSSNGRGQSMSRLRQAAMNSVNRLIIDAGFGHLPIHRDLQQRRLPWLKASVRSEKPSQLLARAQRILIWMEKRYG